jgi:hypothetical protein
MRRLPSKNLINEIRNRYINENLESDEDPNLPELAEEYEVDYTLLMRIWSRENWLNKRNKMKERFLLRYDEKESELLEQVVTDIVLKKKEYLETNVKLIDECMPDIVDELKRRIPVMDDKQLLTFLAQLIKLQDKVEGSVQDNTGHRKSSTGDERDDFLANIGLAALYAEHLQKRKDGLEAKSPDTVAAEELERRAALQAMEAEVVEIRTDE